MFRISSWTDITNAHLISGPGIIDALWQAGNKCGGARDAASVKLTLVWCRRVGLLLVAEMSSAGSLATGSYTERCVEEAKAHPEAVFGFIAGRSLTPDSPELLVFTPGVHMQSTADALDQRYTTPDVVCVLV